MKVETQKLPSFIQFQTTTKPFIWNKRDKKTTLQENHYSTNILHGLSPSIRTIALSLEVTFFFFLTTMHHISPPPQLHILSHEQVHPHPNQKEERKLRKKIQVCLTPTQIKILYLPLSL